MEDNKGFYADFTCHKEFFQVPDEQFTKQVDLLLNGIRTKIVDARSQLNGDKGFTFDIKGCELTGFGWK